MTRGSLQVVIFSETHKTIPHCTIKLKFTTSLVLVSFWVLAVDHDLQIASGVIGTVSMRDPAGTKVALWDQIPLDEGNSNILADLTISRSQVSL